MTHLVDVLVARCLEAADRQRAGDSAWLLPLLSDFLSCTVEGRLFRPESRPAWAPLRGVDAEAASFAVDCHRHDSDDVHFETLTHPGSVVWPAVLALGREVPLPSRTLIAAAAAGYEAVVLVARAYGPQPLHHLTGTAGAAGAAVASSIVLGATAAQAADAVAHAVSAAGGSAQALVEGSGTRLYHRAAAVRNGIAAAVASRSGLTATRRVFEGELGLLAGYASPAPGRLVDAAQPAVNETCVRPYATSGYYQAAVSAVSGLARVPDGTVHVHVPAEVMAHSARAPDGARLEDAVATVLAHGPEGLAVGLVGPPTDVRLMTAGMALSEAWATGPAGASAGHVPSAGDPAAIASVRFKAKALGRDSASIEEHVSRLCDDEDLLISRWLDEAPWPHQTEEHG